MNIYLWYYFGMAVCMVCMLCFAVLTSYTFFVKPKQFEKFVCLFCSITNITLISHQIVLLSIYMYSSNCFFVLDTVYSTLLHIFSFQTRSKHHLFSNTYKTCSKTHHKHFNLCPINH